jgi:hypothetical protein
MFGGNLGASRGPANRTPQNAKVECASHSSAGSWINDASGSFLGGLYALAGISVFAVIVTVIFVRGRDPKAVITVPAPQKKAT